LLERSSPAAAVPFEHLPFAAQLAWIDRVVAEGQATTAAELLALTAGLRDHEPLAHALRRLAQARQLQRAELAVELRRLLPRLPDTGLQRVLRGLEGQPLPVEERTALEAALEDTLRALPAERLVAICLLDRWLKLWAPERRRAVVEGAAAEARERLRGGLAGLDDALLLRLPAGELAALAELAGVLGLAAPWRERQRGFAERVLEILEVLPKSLSQANAEELLARRVYTDRGHFFFELLQNAEDAGARAWRVTIDEQQIDVWHDGLAFDAKDVAGILSIGQTTKHRDQIGLFGVGFKSVYEVCERPQVHSGPFHFEIADVSIPRRVAPAGDGAGTLLVLPLRVPGDAALIPAALFERAAAIPAETLLTLRSLRSLEVRCGSRSRTIRALPDDGRGSIALLHVEEGRVDRYLVERESFSLAAAPGSGEGAQATPVLVAVAQGEDGLPRPLAAGAATVFSYLPTGERSGLRFLVHAHFRVPVDRERLDLTSPHNTWALARAGELLARLVRRLRDAVAAGGAAPDAVEALLEVLPLPEELRHAAYAPIHHELRSGLAAVACLRGAAPVVSRSAPPGREDRGPAWLEPRRAALLADSALAPVLAGVELDEQGRRALAPLAPRAGAVAVSLGALRFGGGELVALLEGALADVEPGALLPAWLAEGLPAILGALGRASEAPLERLRERPLLLDQEGRARPPATTPRAERALRAIYGDARPLLAEALELDPGPDVQRALQRLGVPRLGPAELIADLRSPVLAARILREGAGAEARLSASLALLALLEQQPLVAVRELGASAVFLDEELRLRPLQAPSPEAGPAWLPEAGPAWLPAAGALGELLRALPRGGAGARPPLLHQALSQAHAPLLERLGARALELPALCDLVRGGLELGEAPLRQLHALLDELRADLTPRLLGGIAATPLFLDAHGRRRALAGPERALLPADAAITSLAPGAPWLDERLRGLRYLQGLAEPVGPRAVVRALLLEEVGLLDPFDPAVLRGAYGYLAERAERVPPAERASLAAAPVWLDEEGERRCLDELRAAPAEPLLAELYHRWRAFPLIETACSAGTSAAALVQALGLGERLRSPDHAGFVRDLAARPPEPAGPLRGLLLEALTEAARRLSPAALAPLRGAAIFRDATGVPRTLGSWDEDGPGSCAAREPLRGVLLLGSRPLLHPEDQEALRPIWQALGAREATALDLVCALERDPALASPPAREAARTALAASRAELAAAVAAGLRPERLRALPLWPTEDGRLLGAASLVSGRELERALGGEWRALLAGGELPLLAPRAEEEAAALAELIPLRDPLLLLLTRLHDDARPGQPLDEQPAFLRGVEPVTRLLAAVVAARGAAEASQLPLAVDAAGRLRAGALLDASEDERALLEGSVLEEQLAHPAWAARARELDPSLTPALPLRRALGVLADAHREVRPLAAAQGPFGLARPEQRARLYRWLLARAGELAADDQARGLLGRACVLPSAGGVLRSPRELLLEPGLPDLGIDWHPASEVPAELVRWIEEVFQLEEERLERLVGFLVDAHEAAAQARDGARSEELLGFLVRCLRASAAGVSEALERLPRRLHLRRRLQLEAEGGRFLRPRSMLAASAEEQALLSACCEEPPPCLSARYGEATRGLALALGARHRLAEEELARLLRGEGRRSGEAAALALARYLAPLAAGEPALRSALRLDTTAWIPSLRGELRAPRELYWPDAELETLLGERPDLLPHPELLHALPEPVRAWLPFRSSEDAALGDVAARLRRLPVASPYVLEWLERGLRAGRIAPEELRAELGALAFLLDDDERPRSPGELFLDASGVELCGSRRGCWSQGRELPALASALRVPDRPGARSLLELLAEIAEDLLEAGGPALLEAEPELELTLPRCLAAVGGRQRGRLDPARLPVLAVDREGRRVLCLATDPRLVLVRPEALEGAGLLAPSPPEEGDEELWAALRRAGVREPGERAAARELADRVARTRARREVAPVTEGEPEGEGEGVEGEGRAAGEPGTGDLAPEQEQAEAEAGAEEAAPRRESLTRGRPARSPAGEERAGTWLAKLRRWFWTEDDARAPAGQDGSGETPPGADEEPRRPPARPVTEGRPARPHTEGRSARPHTEGRSAPAAARERRRGGSGGRDPGTRRDPGARREEDDVAEGQRAWFHPRGSIGPQVEGGAGWVERRSERPRFGLAFVPSPLPLPYLYAPQLISHRFDAGRQRWLPASVQPVWSAPAAAGEAVVTFEGRLPRGEALLPIPHYGRLLELELGERGRLLARAEGRAVILALDDVVVRYTVALDRAPRFDDADASAQVAGVDASLLAATVEDDELPGEAHELVRELEGSEAPPLARVLAVRDFIRARYRYDPSYLEDPELARWLRSITRGRRNVHLALLHAGRDHRHLGRGVCYELNGLACELLRRAGIPAAVAVGWTLDRGQLSEPDHLWAVALLPTAGGPRWLPVDASTTATGRPLRASRPPGGWQVGAPAQRAAPPPPAWDERKAWRRRARTGGGSGGGHELELARVVRHLEELTGERLGGSAEVRQCCRRLLEDAEAARALLELLRRL